MKAMAAKLEYFQGDDKTCNQKDGQNKAIGID
jgi:hypothetical protein